MPVIDGRFFPGPGDFAGARMPEQARDPVGAPDALGAGAANGPGAASRTFGELLEKSVAAVNVDQHQADVAIKELIAGRTKNVHETLLAIERADASLKVAMQVRNKILDAYREIMRMQI